MRKQVKFTIDKNNKEGSMKTSLDRYRKAVATHVFWNIYTN